jgi:mono/diheme cytochrome c family protein
VNRRVALRIVLAVAVSVFISAAHTAHADPAGASESVWARATPKGDRGLADSMLQHGKSVFDGHCRACHGAPSSPAARGYYPGTYALNLRYQGKLPAALEERTDLSAERVATVVRHGGGGYMPPLRPTELSDADVKAVAAYLSRRR